MGSQNDSLSGRQHSVIPSAEILFCKIKSLQNTENDCHQWLSGRFRAHQIRFQLVPSPDSAGEAYIAPPYRPPSWFRGALRLRGGKDKGRERKVREG